MKVCSPLEIIYQTFHCLIALNIVANFFFYYFTDNRADKTASKKPYDPAQFTEKTIQPNTNQMQEKVKLLEMDYKALHDKRLQDVSDDTRLIWK